MPVRVVKSEDMFPNWQDLLAIANVGETDIVIEQSGKPIAAVVNYDKYLRTKGNFEELHTLQNADEMVQEWLRNPKSGRPYSEIRSQLVEEGILNE
jgi:hypothetical protein